VPHQVTTILALLNVPPKLYEALSTAPSSSAAGGRNEGARDGAEPADRQRKGKKTRREVSPRKAPQAQHEPSPRGSRISSAVLSAKPAGASNETGGGGATTKRGGVKPPAPPDHTKDHAKEKDKEMKPSTPRGAAKEKPPKSMRARPPQFGVEPNVPAARALRG
jgi:hypothetical protein